MEFFSRSGKLYMNDQEISLRGINWFGLETGANAVHGLWSASLDNLVKGLKENKFNAVRLTMSAEVMLNLNTAKTQYTDESRNPGMSNMTAGQCLDAVVKKCKEAGILIMLNMHRMKASEDISELWYTNEYPESKVIDAWVAVTKRYINEPHVFAMDLKNEPYGKSSWGGDKEYDWAAASERIGNSIHAVNPKVLIFVAGVTLGIWGDSVEGATQRPIKLKVPNKVVLTPHLYKHWRYPDKEGHNNKEYFDRCFGNVARSKSVAIVVGEYGYTPEDEVDTKWVHELADYMSSLGLNSSFFWCYNNNGAYNHGLLKSDWQTIDQGKMNVIKKFVPNPTLFDFKQLPNSAQLNPQPTPVPVPTTQVPTPVPTPSPIPQASNPDPQQVTSNAIIDVTIDVTINKVESWNDGKSNFIKQEFFVKNKSSSFLKNVVLSYVGPSPIMQSWSSTQNGNEFSFPDWIKTGGGLAPNTTWSFGFIIKGNDKGKLIVKST